MLLQVITVLFFIVIFGVETESTCQVGNHSYELKERWYKEGACVAYECSKDGPSTLGCDVGTVVPGYQRTPVNTSQPFPQCCGGTAPLLDIVPDVLEKLGKVEYLDIVYDDNTTVQEGNELTPTQVKNQPVVNFTADPDGWYTLCMTDPDVPSRKEPTRKEFKHWLVGNIPGNKVHQGEVLADYIGSGPPQGSGLHRYFFFVYKQPGKITFDEPKVSKTSIEGRRYFSIRKYAEKHRMDGPVALNVYQAQWDDYVPVLYEQLGFTKN